jgi:hypothetical protein
MLERLYFYPNEEERQLLDRSCNYYGLSHANLLRQILWTALQIKELVLVSPDRSCSQAKELEIIVYQIPDNIAEAWFKLCKDFPLRKQKKRMTSNDSNFCFHQFVWYLPRRDTKDGEVLDIMIDRPVNWDMWEV